MPFRGGRQSLFDIVDHIRLARDFTAGMTLEIFVNDLKTLYATTRCLEIISEASRGVSAEMKVRPADVPWPIIAAAGNVYRHDYRAVRAERIWNTVHNELTALETAVRLEIDVPDAARE